MNAITAISSRQTEAKLLAKAASAENVSSFENTLILLAEPKESAISQTKALNLTWGQGENDSNAAWWLQRLLFQ